MSPMVALRRTPSQGGRHRSQHSRARTTSAPSEGPGGGGGAPARRAGRGRRATTGGRRSPPVGAPGRTKKAAHKRKPPPPCRRLCGRSVLLLIRACAFLFFLSKRTPACHDLRFWTGHRHATAELATRGHIIGNLKARRRAVPLAGPRAMLLCAYLRLAGPARGLARSAPTHQLPSSNLGRASSADVGRSRPNLERGWGLGWPMHGHKLGTAINLGMNTNNIPECL